MAKNRSNYGQRRSYQSSAKYQDRWAYRDSIARGWDPPAGLLAYYVDTDVLVSDDFSSDTGLFTGSNPANPAVTGGALVCTPTTSYYRKSTDFLYNLWGRSAEFYDIANMFDGTVSSAAFFIRVQPTVADGERLQWDTYVSGGVVQLRAARVNAAGTTTAVATLTYSATDHKDLRIRHDRDTRLFYWDYRGATGDWVNAATYSVYASWPYNFATVCLNIGSGLSSGTASSNPSVGGVYIGPPTSAGSDATVTASVVAAVAAVPSATPGAGAGVAAALVTAIVAQPAATKAAGSTVVATQVAAPGATVFNPTKSAGSTAVAVLVAAPGTAIPLNRAAITEDTGNQPAAVTWTGGWGSSNPRTTAAFTPQSGTLLLALLDGDGPTSTAVTGTVTDSTGEAWTLLKRSNMNSAGMSGTAEIWCRYVAAAPGSITVTAQSSNNSLTAGGQLKVMCLLGAEPAQTGATGSFFTTVNAAIQCSVAASYATSVIYGAGYNWSNSNLNTMLGNSTAIQQFQDTTNGDCFTTFKSTTTTVGATVYGFTTVLKGNIAAVEILAARLPSAGSTVSAAVVAAVAAVPAPVFVGGSDASITATAVTAVAVVPTPTTSASILINAALVAPPKATVPLPTLGTGSTVGAALVVAPGAAVPAHTKAGGAGVTAILVAPPNGTTIPLPTITAVRSVSITATLVQAYAAVLSHTEAAGATVFPAVVAASVGAGGGYDADALALSPKILLKLDETSGTALDDSGSVNVDWTAVNSPTLGDTPLIAGSGKAATFVKASSQYATVSNSGITSFVNAMAGVTIAAWMKVPSGAEEPYAVVASDGSGIPFALGIGGQLGDIHRLHVGHYTSGTWYYVFDGSSPGTVDDGAVHFFVGTISSGGQITLYRDGTQVAQSTLTAPGWGSWTGADVHLAKRWDFYGPGGGPYRDITLDGVAIYDSVLTSGQISALYSAGSTVPSTGIPKPTVTTGATVTATQVAAVATVPAATLALSQNVTPALVAAPGATIPSPTKSTGSTVTAALVAAPGTTIPSPTKSTGSTVTAALVAAVAAQPSPTEATGSTVTAAAVVCLATVGGHYPGAGTTVAAVCVEAVGGFSSGGSAPPSVRGKQGAGTHTGSVYITQAGFDVAPQAGDLLVAVVWTDSRTTALAVSGWTNEFFHDAGTYEVTVLTRPWDSGDGNYVFNNTVYGGIGVACYALSGADVTAPVLDSVFDVNTSSTTAGPITPTVDNTLVFASWLGGSVYGKTPAAPFTKQLDVNSGYMGGSMHATHELATAASDTTYITDYSTAPIVAMFAALAGGGRSVVGTVSVSTGATVTPAVVAAVATVPLPTISRGQTIAATLVAAPGATIPLPVRSAGSTHTATQVAAVAGVIRPAFHISITAAVVQATTTVPAVVLASNASITATLVAAVAAIGAHTPAAGQTVAATVVTGVTTIPSPTKSTGSTVTAALVSAIGAVPSPTEAAGALVTAALVTAPGAVVPTPTLSIGQNIAATAVAAVASIGAHTPSAGQRVTAVLVAAPGAVIPAPTLSTGARPTPAAVAAIAAVGAHTPSSGSLISAALVTGVAAVGLPDLVISPFLVNAVTTIPLPVVSSSLVKAAALVAAPGAAIPLPTVSASSTRVSVQVAAVTTIPTPTITSSVSITPAVVAAVASVIRPAFHVSVTAVQVAGVTAIPLPVVRRDAAVAAALVAAPGASIALPTLAAGQTVAAALVSAVTAIATPTVSNGQTLAPAVVAAVAAVGPHTVITGSGAAVSPALVMAVATVPAPTPAASTTVGAVLVAAVASVAGHTPSAGSRAVPAQVAAVGAVGGPVLAVHSAITAVPVAAVASVGAAAAGASAAITASPVSAVTTVGAHTPRASSTVVAVPVAASTSIATPTGSASTQVAATLVAAVTAVGPHTVAAGQVITPAVVAAVASVGPVTVRRDASIAAVQVSGVAAVGAPVLAASCLVSAVPVAAAASVTGHVPHAGVTIGAALVGALTAIPLPGVSANTSVNVSPSPVAAVAALPAAGVHAGTTVAAGLVSGAGGVPSPVLSTGSTVAPAAVAARAAQATPEVAAGSLPTPAAVEGITWIGATLLSTGSGVLPAPVAAYAGVDLPTLSASSEVLADAVLAYALVGSPVPDTPTTVIAAIVRAYAGVDPPVLTTLSPGGWGFLI